ncbi:MAG: hypothetical protein Q8S33_16910 [Myxococcales bacterium]|nr:hypothetical protein [Myxococcales bacterium]MDP3502019.1 hypothetical protein [Myxococcales bacterium]
MTIFIPGEEAQKDYLMPGEMVLIRDDARSRLRKLLALMQEQLAASTDSVGRPGLQRSFEAVVTELDLGPEPKLRSCTFCGAVGMRDATLCSVCWSKLAPLSVAPAP